MCFPSPMIHTVKAIRRHFPQFRHHRIIVASSCPAKRREYEAARILLAEDGNDNQRLISALLRKSGAEVSTATDGKTALETALRSREVGEAFDLILMDMQMPVMDGYEATRRLREAEWTGPIIALTASVMAGDREKCLDAGCTDFLTKPITRRDLVAGIAPHLAQNP